MKIAVTGHRKIISYEPRPEHVILREHMQEFLAQRKKEHQNLELISGCALGVDQWWMSVGQILEIPVIAAIPFEGFDTKWPIEAKRNLQDLLARCHKVKYISGPGFSPHKLQKRNKWMVDNCDLLVAYWNGSDGGTKNCYDYAIKQKKDIIRFNPNELVSKI